MGAPFRFSVFGLTAALLLALAVFFTVRVESRRVTWKNQVSLESGQPVEVSGIVDGDEVRVRVGDADFSVRLLGLKCFSSVVNEPGIQGAGAACAESLTRRLAGKRVVIEFEAFQTDDNDRVLAYLSADGEDVALGLIEAGLGLAFTRYVHPREAAYLLAERRAKEAFLGLWGNAETLARAQALKAVWTSEREAAQ
jgi:endonuclease YncB( thermonuclease family)